MVVTYHGESYFKLQSGRLTVLVDPTNLRSAKGADATISTLKPATVPQTDETVWIDHQGEYEIKELHIVGWSNGNDGKYERTIYLLEMDEINIVLLGRLTKEPEEKVFKLIKKPDIAIIGLEGKPALDETATAKVLKILDPAIIILAAAKDPKTLLKEFKRKSCETQEKLVIKKKDIPANETRIVCLKA